MPRRKPAPTQHDAEPIRLTDLKPHPRNYRRHPADQLAHIKHSLTEHGQYRNIVTADDLTVLAGHGVWLAATELGWETARVVRLPIAADSPGALKILTGDNEIGLTAEIDDRLLTEILREIRDTAELVGTGYDDMMMANLLMVTRPASEIAGHDAAAARHPGRLAEVRHTADPPARPRPDGAAGDRRVRARAARRAGGP